MKFSIICPFFNSKETISETICSVLKQDYPDWELVLVNDNSSDNSFDICKEYQLNDNRIVLINKDKNDGPYHSRLIGLSASSGEYILFLDSDDLLAPNALSELEHIIRNDSPDIVLFEYTRERTQMGYIAAAPLKRFCLENTEKILRYLFVENLLPNLWTKCYRKTLFEREFEPCNIKYSEDMLFLFNIVINAKKMIVTNNVLIFYRDNNNSITHNLSFIDVEDSWNTYNFLFLKLYNLRIFNGVFLSRQVIENVYWGLFMVVWFADHFKHPNVYNDIRNTYLYKRIESVKVPKINFTVNHVLKWFIKKRDKRVDLFKKIYNFCKGRRKK